MAFELISSVLGTVLDVLVGLFDVFAGIFSGNWQTAWNGVKEVFSSIWNGIVDFFGVIWERIGSSVTGALSAIGAAISAAWNGISSAISSVMEGISQFLSISWNAIKALIAPIVEGIKSGVNSAWNTMKTTISSVMDGIKSKVSSVWEGSLSLSLLPRPMSRVLLPSTMNARTTSSSSRKESWILVARCRNNQGWREEHDLYKRYCRLQEGTVQGGTRQLRGDGFSSFLLPFHGAFPDGGLPCKEHVPVIHRNRHQLGGCR